MKFIDKLSRGFKLKSAVKNYDIETCTSLIEQGVSKGAMRSAFWWAAYSNQKDIAELIIKNAKSTFEHYNYGNNLLFKTARNNRVKMLQVLLDVGANSDKLNWQGESLLYRAVLEYDFNIVEVLLKGGANPNQQDKKKNIPLYTAYLRSNSAKLELLLIYGADPNTICIRPNSTILDSIDTTIYFNNFQFCSKETLLEMKRILISYGGRNNH